MSETSADAQPAYDAPLITPEEAAARFANGAVVIDVREAGEYNAGHLLDARHIPVGELAKRTAELEKFKDKPIILNCQSGARSASACSILSKAGFARVHNLEGGIAAWEQAGMPISRKRK
mgnify:CR=1 FL=1